MIATDSEETFKIKNAILQYDKQKFRKEIVKGSPLDYHSGEMESMLIKR